MYAFKDQNIALLGKWLASLFVDLWKMRAWQWVMYMTMAMSVDNNNVL